MAARPKTEQIHLLAGDAGTGASGVDETGGAYGAGVITGAKLLKVGEFVEMGGKAVRFTAAQLEAVRDLINAIPTGVPVHLTHAEAAGLDGLEFNVGEVRTARLDGDVLLGDVHIGPDARMGADKGGQVMARAKARPHSFGMSLSLKGRLQKSGEGAALFIPTAVMSADIVGRPATEMAMLAAPMEGMGTETAPPAGDSMDPMTETLRACADACEACATTCVTISGNATCAECAEYCTKCAVACEACAANPSPENMAACATACFKCIQACATCVSATSCGPACLACIQACIAAVAACTGTVRASKPMKEISMANETEVALTAKLAAADKRAADAEAQLAARDLRDQIRAASHAFDAALAEGKVVPAQREVWCGKHTDTFDPVRDDDGKIVDLGLAVLAPKKFTAHLASQPRTHGAPPVGGTGGDIAATQRGKDKGAAFEDAKREAAVAILAECKAKGEAGPSALTLATMAHERAFKATRSS